MCVLEAPPQQRRARRTRPLFLVSFLLALCVPTSPARLLPSPSSCELGMGISEWAMKWGRCPKPARPLMGAFLSCSDAGRALLWALCASLNASLFLCFGGRCPLAVWAPSPLLRPELMLLLQTPQPGLGVNRWQWQWWWVFPPASPAVSLGSQAQGTHSVFSSGPVRL